MAVIMVSHSVNRAWVQLVAVAQPDAVLELGGGQHSPWMAKDKREVLAGIIARTLRLKVSTYKSYYRPHPTASIRAFRRPV